MQSLSFHRPTVWPVTCNNRQQQTDRHSALKNCNFRPQIYLKICFWPDPYPHLGGCFGGGPYYKTFWLEASFTLKPTFFGFWLPYGSPKPKLKVSTSKRPQNLFLTLSAPPFRGGALGGILTIKVFDWRPPSPRNGYFSVSDYPTDPASRGGTQNSTPLCPSQGKQRAPCKVWASTDQWSGRSPLTDNRQQTTDRHSALLLRFYFMWKVLISKALVVTKIK